jgi:hypothetical protein
MTDRFVESIFATNHELKQQKRKNKICKIKKELKEKEVNIEK